MRMQMRVQQVPVQQVQVQQVQQVQQAQQAQQVLVQQMSVQAWMWARRACLRQPHLPMRPASHRRRPPPTSPTGR
jgi:hypothetical protein